MNANEILESVFFPTSSLKRGKSFSDCTTNIMFRYFNDLIRFDFIADNAETVASQSQVGNSSITVMFYLRSDKCKCSSEGQCTAGFEPKLPRK